MFKEGKGGKRCRLFRKKIVERKDDQQQIQVQKKGNMKGAYFVEVCTDRKSVV